MSVDESLEVLGLTRENATLREVKRAYAKLIKIHRPDHDPEKFAEIHRAYQCVQNWLADLEATPVQAELVDDGADEAGMAQFEESLRLHPPPSVTTPAKPPPLPGEQQSAEWPEEFRPIVISLMQALAAMNEPEAVQHLSQLTQLCHENASLWTHWDHLLDSLQEPQVHVIGRPIKANDLLAAVAAGAANGGQAVLWSWHRERDFASLALFAQRLLSAAGQYGSVPAGIMASQAAGWLAFDDPTLAGQLADKAFAWLPPGAREQILQRIETRLAVGKTFAQLDRQARLFWEDKLFREKDPHFTWDSVHGRNAIATIISKYDASWPGYQILQTQLPTEVWKILSQRVRPAQPQLAQFDHQSQNKKSSSIPKLGGWINWIWVVAIVFYNVVKGCSHRTADRVPRNDVPEWKRESDTMPPSKPIPGGGVPKTPSKPLPSLKYEDQ